MTQRRFEVATHARRDDDGPRVLLPDIGRHLSEPRERVGRVHAERCDSHHPTQVESRRRRDPVGQLGDVHWQGAAPSTVVRGARVERNLDECTDRPIRGNRSGAQCLDELGPVNLMDDFGIANDRSAFVALQPPNEVPPQRKISTELVFGCGLLVPVFADVGDAEF
jgi:hypothetical protein